MEKLVCDLSLHLKKSKDQLMHMSAEELFKIFGEKLRYAIHLKHMRNYEEAEYAEEITDKIKEFIFERFEFIEKNRSDQPVLFFTGDFFDMSLKF